jgi:hypothetical protein
MSWRIQPHRAAGLLALAAAAAAFWWLQWGAASPARAPAWRVRSAYSAHHTLVVRVETRDPSAALEIARQVVGPVADRYVEVLVYVYGPSSQPTALVRRVRWTPQDGYVESGFTLPR